MKDSFYCEKCHTIYDVGEWATEHEDKAVCDNCGGELAQRDKAGHSDEGGEGQQVCQMVPQPNKELKYWGYAYICIRPHQALGYRTPLQFLKGNGIIRTNYPH